MLRALVFALLCAVLVGCGGSSPKATRLPALHPGRVGPVSMFTIASQLTSAPRPTLNELKRLGVDRVHVYLSWSSIAPHPAAAKQPAFDASDPSAYPAAGWAPYDTVVRGLAARHIGIDLALAGPPPVWAEGPGGSKYDHNENDYEPSAAAYTRWVTAVARRYSGHYTPPGQSSPLPRVSFWSVWNEPNLGTFLAPETAHGGASVEIAPRFYRGLVDGAWRALHATGHGSDTILIGELAPIGADRRHLGVFNVMPPLRFLRALYCVDANLRQLRGTAATARGCPATAAASARFAADNPGLFHASGFADHPYPYGLPPDKASPGGPDDTDLAQIPNLESLLDRVNRIYGSSTRFPIWSTEFGYETNPPNPVTVPMKTAALYLNWAEYLTWSDPRIKSYDQYLLNDPPTATGFTTGLNFYSGKRKPIYAAYQMPLYLPVSTTTKGHPLVVWGDVRPAADAAAPTHTPQVVQIQLQPGSSGPFKTLQHVTITNPHGYFEVRQTFPASGQVRLRWSYPNGETIYSRIASVTIH